MTSAGSPSTLPPTSAASSPNVYPAGRLMIADSDATLRLSLHCIEAFDDFIGQVDGLSREQKHTVIALKDDREALLSPHSSDNFEQVAQHTRGELGLALAQVALRFLDEAIGVFDKLSQIADLPAIVLLLRRLGGIAEDHALTGQF